ncbi:site-specific integrase [Nocardioides maradonensis]
MAARTRRGFGAMKKLASGRWQAFYNDPDGRTTLSRNGKPVPVRHYAGRSFETKVDAEAWLADERRLITSGAWTSPADRAAARRARPEVITFGAYAEAWLAGRKVKGRPLAGRTRDGYRDLLDRLILPTFEEVTLTSITSDMVDAWYETVARGRPTYQARAYGLLRTILGTAVERGLITTANPAKVRGGGTTKRRHVVKPASLSELAILTANVPERRRMMVQLAAWCGLRFGELAELRRKDVDMTHHLIHIRRGVTKVDPPHNSLPDGAVSCPCRPDCVVGPPKTDAGVRDLPIPPHLVGDLKTHLQEYAAPGRDGLLFPGPGGSHLRPSAFYGRVAALKPDGEIQRKGHGYFEARRLAGRPDLHFHDLRHTGLTNAAVAGATLAELMQMAGHSTPGAAMRYQHAASDRMKDLAARLSKMAEAGE